MPTLQLLQRKALLLLDIFIKAVLGLSCRTLSTYDTLNFFHDFGTCLHCCTIQQLRRCMVRCMHISSLIDGVEEIFDLLLTLDYELCSRMKLHIYIDSSLS